MTQQQKIKIRLFCGMLCMILLPVIGMLYGVSGGFFDFILYDGLWFGLLLGCLCGAVLFWILLRGLVDWRRVKYFLLGYGVLYIVLCLCFQINFEAYRFYGSFFAYHILLAAYVVWTVVQTKHKTHATAPIPSSGTPDTPNTPCMLPASTGSTGSTTWRNFAIGYTIASFGVLLFLLIRYGYDFSESQGIVALGVLISFLYDILGFFLLILSNIILLLSYCLRNVVGILVCAAFHILYGLIYVGLFLLLHMLTPVTIGAILCLIFGIITYIYYFSLPKSQRDWRKTKTTT